MNKILYILLFLIPIFFEINSQLSAFENPKFRDTSNLETQKYTIKHLYRKKTKLHRRNKDKNYLIMEIVLDDGKTFAAETRFSKTDPIWEIDDEVNVTFNRLSIENDIDSDPDAMMVYMENLSHPDAMMCLFIGWSSLETYQILEINKDDKIDIFVTLDDGNIYDLFKESDAISWQVGQSIYFLINNESFFKTPFPFQKERDEFKYLHMMFRNTSSSPLHWAYRGSSWRMKLLEYRKNK